MADYIHQLAGWPSFVWKSDRLMEPLTMLRLRQGRLLGKMEALGFQQRGEAELQARTQEVVKSSEIEGEILNPDQVRSSIAKKLGMEAAAIHPMDRRIEGIVEMALEATRNYADPLTQDRLVRWHRGLFPDSPSIRVGAWRDDARGPMQVVSGRHHVHFEAPPAASLAGEMKAFLEGVNGGGDLDAILRAGIAHLWFVTIHPFEDGNGRIARVISDWALARSEGSSRRYYSLSAQIRQERQAYYEILERTQRGTLEITEWLLWFLGCLDRAIAGTESSLTVVLRRDQFWRHDGHLVKNERQRIVLNLLLDGEFKGKLTSSKWARIAKCSQDTATRDLQDLVKAGLLVKDRAGGRSTSYSLSPRVLPPP